MAGYRGAAGVAAFGLHGWGYGGMVMKFVCCFLRGLVKDCAGF